jgi:3-oxocholest-4-en-26-oate---CoA ligase
MAWNYGDVLDAAAKAVEPESLALIHGARRINWAAFDQRSNALARAFLAAGAQPHDKVAHFMRNSPAYCETSAACFKARLVHVNVNYRYSGDELLYIFDNSDAAVIVYDRDFAADIAALAPRLAKVKLFVEVQDDAATPRNGFAQDFETLACGQGDPLDVRRAPSDMLFIYTGGTTGMPKGVMWELSALWSLMGGGAASFGLPALTELAELQANIRAGLGRERLLVCPPLMHGSGYLMAIYTLARGGCVVTLPGASFDAAATAQAIHTHRPTAMVIVGDAFARPLLNSLNEFPARFDISSLRFIISSGTMWSPEVKAGLLRHNPSMLLLDALGSSESLGLGMAIGTAANADAPTRFKHDENTRVLDDDGKDVAPGSGDIGRIARSGLLPLGYYKDDAKTAATFVRLEGKRYAIAGDHATVDADGSITLLGRGNQCINTGGEKVFPEEVEESLKTHPYVQDALVVGVPDAKWGTAVTALVEQHGDASEDALRAHVRQFLAGYKVPKHIVFVRRMPRASNGKADYKTAKALALQELGHIEAPNNKG